jgi:hypothetical protein
VRLVVPQPLLFLPEQQFPRQIQVAASEEHGLHWPGRVLAVRQDERVPPDVTGS